MRKLMTWALAFSAGSFLAQYLLPGAWLLPAACASLAAACGALALPDVLRRRVLLAGVGLAVGLGWNWLYIRQVQLPMEALADTEQTGVRMTVLEYPEEAAYGIKVTVRLEGFSRGKAVYYGGEDLADLEPGMVVTADVRFQSAARIREDEITTFTSKGVFLLAYNRGGERAEPGSAGALRWLPARLGHTVGEWIDASCPDRTAPFLKALLVGDRSALPAAVSSAMSEAGLSHVLAVSGMHCTFLLLPLQLVFMRRRRLRALLGMTLLWGYALMTGCSPSVVRACVMCSFLLVASLFGRENDSPTALSAALAAILLQNPFAAASISLQLSFASVAGIMLVVPRLEKLLAEKRRSCLVKAVIASFSVTVGALVFTTPLLAWYFNSLVLISPVSNLLCLPAVSLTFLSGFFAVAVSFLPGPLVSVSMACADLLAEYVMTVSGLLARVPYHAVYFSNPYLKYWLVYVYVLFAVAWACRRGGGRRYLLCTGAAALTLVLTVFLGALRYAGSRLEAMVLDVGQGQCVLLASGGTFALVDCGSSNSWYDAGGIAADTLRSMGCRTLDYLVLTHYDADHINGVEELLNRMEVETLLVPGEPEEDSLGRTLLEQARAQGTCVAPVEAVQTLPLGESCLTLYPPVGEGESNEEGLCALCSAGSYDLLITGDMDAGTEAALLERYDLPDIETLVAGHHGARTSTSRELLEALTPERAFISVGSNSYGHPSEQTLRRLVEAGAEIFRTDKQGTIHLTVN